MDNKAKRPTNITIFAILALIGGVSLFTISILMFLKIIEPDGLELVYLLFSIFPFIIAYGFFTAKNWARIIFIFYLIIGAIYYIWQNIEQPFNVLITIISIVIVIYILTRPYVKEYFQLH